MLAECSFQGRQLKDLPPLFTQVACDLTERRPTGRALRWRVLHHLIWLGHLLQRRVRMPWLPTGLSLRGLAQRARLFDNTITRGGLAAVAALGGQAVFQCCDPGMELHDLLLLLRNEQIQRLDQGNHCFWPWFVDSSDFLTGHHNMSVSQIFTSVCLLARKQRG